MALFTDLKDLKKYRFNLIDLIKMNIGPLLLQIIILYIGQFNLAFILTLPVIANPFQIRILRRSVGNFPSSI